MTPPIPNTRRVGITGRRRRHPAVGGDDRVASRPYERRDPPDRVERPVGVLPGQEDPREHQPTWRSPCCRPVAPMPARSSRGAQTRGAARQISRTTPRRTRRKPREGRGDGGSRSVARCASTSARACWSSGSCCARCISWPARGSFRSSASLRASPAPRSASGASALRRSGLARAVRAARAPGAASAGVRGRCVSAPPASASAAGAAARIEARSANYSLVGVVHGDSMTIHVSRLLDNAPVRDAAVDGRCCAGAMRRGGPGRRQLPAQGAGTRAARAGGHGIPRRAGRHARKGSPATLQSAGTSRPDDDKQRPRQYAWWVLNFGVCVGFLLLWSAAARPPPTTGSRSRRSRSSAASAPGTAPAESRRCLAAETRGRCAGRCRGRCGCCRAAGRSRRPQQARVAVAHTPPPGPADVREHRAADPHQPNGYQSV